MNDPKPPTPTDAERLKALIKELSLSPYQLSLELKYKSPSSVYHVLKGRLKLSKGMMKGIIAKWPQVNYSYLKTGRGDLFLKNKSQMIAQQRLFDLNQPKPVHLFNQEHPEKDSIIANLEERLNLLSRKADETNDLLQSILREQRELKKVFLNRK